MQEKTREQSGQMKGLHASRTKKHGKRERERGRIFERICQKLELYTADEAEPEVAQNFYPFVLVWKSNGDFQAMCIYKIAGNCDIEGGKKIFWKLFNENSIF